MQNWKRLASLDPKRLDPVQMVRAVGIEPDDWQKRLLRSKAPRILVNCSRQSGKSTTTAALADHTAFYEPGSLILLLSPGLRQSQELFRKCLDFYRALDRPVAPEAESALRLELENGSRLVALPGGEATVRGFSGVKLLIIDEASRVLDPLYMSVRPMLAVSGGRIIALSSPAGRRGWWYEAWTDGGESWERYQVRAEECPRISKAFLEEERRALGPSWYAQEYECEFTSDINSVFPEAYLQRIISDEEHAWTIPPPDWTQPKPVESSPVSWGDQITIPERDPRLTPYGVPWP